MDWLIKKLFSINGYMLVAVVLALVISMPFMYKNIMDAYKGSAFEQFETHVREEAGLLSDVISLVSVEDQDNVKRIIDSALLKGQTTYIDVVDRVGKKIFSANIDGSSSAEPVEDTQVSGNSDDTYYIFLPVNFVRSKDIYTLRIGFDESSVLDEYRELKNRVYIILVIYTLVLALLMSAATRLILKPLRELRLQSRYIAEGEINVPMEISTRLNDIRYLARDLEFMRMSLVEMAERMHYKATHDDLTSLPNRFLFNDRLTSAISISQRENRPFAVLLIDLDRFKEINDTLGHGIGDEILKAVASSMLQRIRESDTLARIGGDEFSIILMGVEQILAEKLALKLMEAIEPPIHIGNHTLKVGASIGIAIYPRDGHNAELLMQRADVAMYSSKRNNLMISCYHEDMDGDSYENLVLASDMKKAIQEEQFYPLFQPKIDLLTNKPCGCEILLRWQHPQFGLISPDKFIPLAEQENLTGILAQHIVGKYFSRLNEVLDEQAEFHLAINVSPHDLLDNLLFNTINNIVHLSKFPASRLYIEVTENAIMKNPVRSADILNRFNDAGIRVSVDDFGTGYSSLAYLQKFPISELKIDKSFIINLTRESNNYPIVNATITMAHDLGICVVAEGVEDNTALGLLQELGCERAQGYYFSQPLAYDEFAEWMKSWADK